jgi:hypothetical protein
VNPNASDEADARALALRLAGPDGAERLLGEAREEVAAIVAEQDFRAEVERVATELLRRRDLDSEAIRTLTTEEPHPRS